MKHLRSNISIHHSSHFLFLLFAFDLFNFIHFYGVGIISEKELGITATLNIDDVLSGLDDLIDRLSQIPDGISTDIDVSGVEELSDSASDAELSLEQVQEAAGMVGTDLSGIDTTSLESVASSASDAASNISSVGDSASGVDLSLEAIGEAAAHVGTGISDIASNMSSAREQTQGATGATFELAEGFGAVEGVVSTLVGIGLAAWLEDAVTSAMDSIDAWNLLGAALEDSGVSIDTAKPQIISLANEHGFLASQVRDSTKVFVQAGMSYKDVIKDHGALEAAMAISSATGQDLTSSAMTLQRAYMGQGRQLKLLGIDLNDYKDATTGVVDKEALHAAILAKLGGQLDAHATSYEALMNRLGTATGKLQVSLGKVFLPTITAVVNGIIWLINSFMSLPDSIKNVILGITAFGGVVATLAGLWAGLVTLLGGSVTASFGAIATVLTGTGAGVSGLLASIGPLGWAILAVIGIVLSAIYVWSQWSDEIIRLKGNLLSGNWGAAAAQIGGSFQYIGQAIWNALVYAGQVIWNFFAGLPAMIGNMTSWFVDMGSKVVMWIVTGLTSLAGMLDTILNALLVSMADTGSGTGESSGKTVGEKTGNGIVDGFINWINAKGPTMLNTLATLLMKMLPLINQIVFTVLNIVAAYMYIQGRAAAIRLVNGILGYIRTLPSKMLSLMVQAAYGVLRFGSLAYSYARSAGSRIVSALASALASLPGRMYTWGRNAVNSFINAIINSIPGLRAALNQIKAFFPHSPPKEGPLSEITTRNMYDWMRTIAVAGMEGLSSFNMDNIMIPDDAALTVAGSTTNSTNQTYQFVIKKGAVQIAGNASSETIAKAGETLGESIARGAISNGINTRIDLQ